MRQSVSGRLAPAAGRHGRSGRGEARLVQQPTPSSDTAHAQDVVLCTSYALIDAALRHPIQSGRDALPAIAPLRLALMENPDADPQVREAITGAVEAYDAILAKDAKPQGLSQPPAYDPATVQAALERVALVCGLTE